MFENFKVFNYELAGRPLVIETGKMAGLANGSCLVRYGDTSILACATASAKPRDGIDFLPLSVDFEERLYSVGRIPGGYFRREGKPTEKAILTSRVIDRPIRPLFPKDLRNDVNLSLTVLSVDRDCSPEIAAMIGASIALSISDIPWNGPIGGVFVLGDYLVRQMRPTSHNHAIRIHKHKAWNLLNAICQRQVSLLTKVVAIGSIMATNPKLWPRIEIVLFDGLTPLRVVLIDRHAKYLQFVAQPLIELLHTRYLANAGATPTRPEVEKHKAPRIALREAYYPTARLLECKVQGFTSYFASARPAYISFNDKQLTHSTTSLPL